MGLGLIKIRAFVGACNIVTIVTRLQIFEWIRIVEQIKLSGLLASSCDNYWGLRNHGSVCFKSPSDYFRSSSCIHFILSIFYSFGVTNPNSNYKQVMTHKSMNIYIYVIHNKSQKKTSTKPLFFLLALQPHSIKEINFKTTLLK